MTDADGAPIYGGVTDPAPTSGPGIPLPAYGTMSIAACPHCYGDLDYEGDGYWCPPCQRSWNFTQVVLYEDADRDE